jgi:hypothetical protein
MSVNIPFLQFSVVTRNVQLLARALNIENVASAADAYSQALQLIQGWMLRFDSYNRPSILFEGASGHEEVFSHFLALYDRPIPKPFDVHEISAISAALTESLELLARLHGDARKTFDLLVQVLLVVRIPAFGSLSDALSMIVAGPEAAWSRLEITELLWHETVHQALFLEDLVESLFSVDQSQLGTPEACVPNPLLGINRPFDLAFHGTAVSVALIDLHLRAKSHRRVAQLIPTLAPSLDELMARRNLLSRRGNEILDELVVAVSQLTAGFVDLSSRGEQEKGEHFSRRSYLDLQH